MLFQSDNLWIFFASDCFDFIFAGFSGDLCNFEYNECDSDPCVNGGQCVDHIGEFSCQCTKGYQGKRCQVKVCVIKFKFFSKFSLKFYRLIFVQIIHVKMVIVVLTMVMNMLAYVQVQAITMFPIVMRFQER